MGSASLLFPFGRDHGTFAYIAKLILNGKIDYKYSIDLKLPAIHYTFVLGQFIFGKSIVGMRIFDILWQISTACIVFLITKKITCSDKASLISSFMYLFLYFRMDYWQTMQTEGFMNLPFLICIYLMLGTSEFYKKVLFFSGIFFAITFLYKFTVAAFILLFPLIIIFYNKEIAKVKFKKTFYFLLGFIVLMLLVFAYLYFNGALLTMLDDQYNQISRYAEIGYGTESSSFIIRNLIKLFIYSVYSPFIFLSIVLFILFIKNKTITYNYFVLFIWLLSVLVSLIGQWKFFIYHFLILIPPIIILSVSLFVFLKEKYGFGLKKGHKILVAYC